MHNSLFFVSQSTTFPHFDPLSRVEKGHREEEVQVSRLDFEEKTLPMSPVRKSHPTLRPILISLCMLFPPVFFYFTTSFLLHQDVCAQHFKKQIPVVAPKLQYCKTMASEKNTQLIKTQRTLLWVSDIREHEFLKRELVAERLCFGRRRRSLFWRGQWIPGHFKMAACHILGPFSFKAWSIDCGPVTCLMVHIGDLCHLVIISDKADLSESQFIVKHRTLQRNGSWIMNSFYLLDCQLSTMYYSDHTRVNPWY